MIAFLLNYYFAYNSIKEWFKAMTYLDGESSIIHAVKKG